MKKGKRYLAAMEKVDRAKLYPMEEAVQVVKDAASVKFDESVDFAASLTGRASRSGFWY